MFFSIYICGNGVEELKFSNYFFLLQYENGEKEVRLFSDTEYEGRLAKLRSEVKYYRSGGLLQYFLLARKNMEEKEVEACVFTSIHNTAYFSNYVYCSMGRPYGLVVGHAGKGTTISSLVDGGHPLRR